MATFELDPVFVKALGYLRSKSKDSTEKLKALVDAALNKSSPSLATSSVITGKLDKVEDSPSADTVGQGKTQVEEKAQDVEGRKGSPHGQMNRLMVPGQKERRSPSLSGSGAGRSTPDPPKKQPDKRSLEKLKQDLTDLNKEHKKPKLEKPDPPTVREGSPPVLKKEQSSDEEEGEEGMETSADEFAEEMGLVCVICRQMNVTPGNQLVECAECHNLYHQDCHRPPVTDSDVNDPRKVWYCQRCTRTIRKMASKAQKSKPTSTISSSREKDQASVKPKTPDLSTMQLFKRSETSSMTSSSTLSSAGSGSQLTGLASWAANISGKSSLPKTPTTTKAPAGPFSSAKPAAAAAGKQGLAAMKAAVTSKSSSSGSSSKFLSSGSSGSTGSGMAKLGGGSGKPPSVSSSSVKPSGSGAAKPGGNGGRMLQLPTSQSQDANKRLQMMKKKAAAKMQQKKQSRF
ncbi:PREDICTED: integrator complex subunit 12-like isoform X2 [Branchiostoma belcheri]|uniref:Integrator complex subunit 12 n=1 Tax=Branchiostoma belcheri TaxID=7741 RepID=A0A6P4Z2Q3_BRABE|nr:PREDICTED: integrator complex subunit 12-like isoform X2 [Branchiostoma belcheri]